MKAHELATKLLAGPNDEVFIWDPDGQDWFPVTNWTYGGGDHIKLYSDDDYLPDDSPWKAANQ